MYRSALWQAEDLVGSIFALLGLALPVPDRTTLSRRGRTLRLYRAAGRPVPRQGIVLLWRALMAGSYGGLGDQALRSPPCSDDGLPCRVMVLSAVGVSRRMMVSEAPAS